MLIAGRGIGGLGVGALRCVSLTAHLVLHDSGAQAEPQYALTPLYG
jgi:hypothetical protein